MGHSSQTQAVNSSADSRLAKFVPCAITSLMYPFTQIVQVPEEWSQERQESGQEGPVTHETNPNLAMPLAQDQPQNCRPGLDCRVAGVRPAFQVTAFHISHSSFYGRRSASQTILAVPRRDFHILGQTSCLGLKAWSDWLSQVSL